MPLDHDTDPDAMGAEAEEPASPRAGTPEVVQYAIVVALAAVALGAMLAGVLGRWGAEPVSRIVVVCVAALVGIRRSPGTGAMVAAAGEVAGVVLGGGA